MGRPGTRYARQRDKNEREIVRALERIGCDVIPMHRPVDLLVGFRNQNWLLEVKMPSGKLTKGQKEFIPSWRGQVAVVTSVDEAIAVVTGK